MKRVLGGLLLAVGTLLFLFPFLWLLSTSFKGAEEVFRLPPALLPEAPTLDNYRGVWSAIPFSLYLFNSLVLAVAATVLNLAISSLAAYALARLRFTGRSWVFLLVLGAMLIPKEIILLPLYGIVLGMGLGDKLAGVLLPFCADAFTVFMLRQAYLGLPRELEEAARMDGCGIWRTWFNIMMPLTGSAMAVAAVFTFIGTWGDFLWPLVVLKSPENYTLQIGLHSMMGTFVSNFRYTAAGSVLALLPVLLLFWFSRKHLEKGFLSGSIKQ